MQRHDLVTFLNYNLNKSLTIILHISHNFIRNSQTISLETTAINTILCPSRIFIDMATKTVLRALG